MEERTAFKVSVAKDYLVFAAGHFIAYEGFRERLHGHNYRVSVELEGGLDDNAYVFDFVALKRIMRALVNELDHKLLLPLHNPVLEVREEGNEVLVRFRDGSRRYVFPREDVVLLPLPNTTAELLSRHFAGRLKEELGSEGAANLTALAISVEETPGQSARYREEL